MTFRYIGSKARIVAEVIDRLGSPGSSGQRFVDLFCGTGVVAEAAAAAGWAVHLNDHLHCAVVMAVARMTGSGNARFAKTGGYGHTIATLDALEGERGYLYRTYSPASVDEAGLERRYFTCGNAARIDAVRSQIASWMSDGIISACEERLLLADLISAANRVANIAGTYGCFLSKWQKQALLDLKLQPRKLKAGRSTVTFSVSEARHVRTLPSDVVYLDPPYTKRHYAAYYHLLETIVLGDAPVVTGVAGIRPWQHKASDFCYKTRALDAFSSLIGQVEADRLLISYSDNAHIPISSLTQRMSTFGTVTPIRLMEIGRYRPNHAASTSRSTVNEYLIEVEQIAARAAA